MEFGGQTAFPVVLVLSNIAHDFEFALHQHFCQLALQSLHHHQHSPQLTQKQPEIRLVFVIELWQEELIVAESEFVDLLYNFVSPLLIVIDVVSMRVSVFPEAAFAEEGEMRTLDFGAVIPGLLLMDLAFLVDASAHVFEFIEGCQFLALHQWYSR